MTLQEVIDLIESKGLFWAVERSPRGYCAVVEKKSYYIGDELSGPGAESGDTPASALQNAFENFRI